MNTNEISVSVYKRAKQRFWQMQYRDPQTGNKVRKSTKQTARREAERAAAKWEQELKDGTDIASGRIEWEEFRELYYRQAAKALAVRTAQKIDGVLNVYERMMKPSRLGDIDERSISEYQQKLRDAGRAEDTIAGHLDHLKAMLNWAVDQKYIGTVPKIRKPRRAKSRGDRETAKPIKGRPIVGEEFDRLLSAVPIVIKKLWITDKLDFNAIVASWEFYLRGLWWSGFRLEESLHLHWNDASKLCIDDVDAAAPTMSIPAEFEKGNADRQFPLAPEFVELLRTVPHREGFVFNPLPLRPSTNRLGGQQVGRMVVEFGKQAGIVVNAKTGKKCSAHDLRRSFGDRWAQRVMPAVLKELMRHQSINTTMRYYVGREATTTAALLWQAAADASVGATLGASEKKRKAKPR